MKLIVVKDYDAMSKEAALEMARVIIYRFIRRTWTKLQILYE